MFKVTINKHDYVILSSFNETKVMKMNNENELEEITDHEIGIDTNA